MLKLYTGRQSPNHDIVIYAVSTASLSYLKLTSPNPTKRGSLLQQGSSFGETGVQFGEQVHRK